MNTQPTGILPPSAGTTSKSAQAADSAPFRTAYPSYQVLSKWDSPSFDDATRRVVAHRLNHVPERRFLEPALFAVLRAVVDCVLPQPERDGHTRIPVEAFIDDMLEAIRKTGKV